MASKRSKAAPTDDELGNLFAGIGDDKAIKKPIKTKPGAAKGPEQDILGELEKELGEKQPPRPHTPRIRDAGSKASPKKPSFDAVPSVDEKPLAVRKSTDSAQSYHASFTPSATSSELPEPDKKGYLEQKKAPAGGGWWGGLLSTATAAMKQAEAAVKEMQQTEEAKKWAGQMRGNVGALRGIGDELRSLALPTFTNILHTLAPPISQHERLLIHITHDFVGYPSLDPLVHGVLSRVMTQVEGGDLIVIQRGQDSIVRSPSGSSGSTAPLFGSAQSAGWRDGPWWRQAESPRDLAIVQGLAEGTRLCRANAEAHAADYFSTHGGVQEARRRALEPASESNPVRSSDLFLCVQAVGVAGEAGLFAAPPASDKNKASVAVGHEDQPGDTVCFAVFVLDPVHAISYATVSQCIPAEWMRWLDAAPALAAASVEEAGHSQAPSHDPDPRGREPEEIGDMIEDGGVDPREWVAEWVEETIALAVGVVAQRYVARRMGVGEGGIGKAKSKVEHILHEGGGEAARAGLI